jgi:hypothetical protein
MTFTGDVDGDLAVVPVVQGVATFVTSSLSVGTSAMSAEYSGDGSHTPAQGVVPLSVVEANPSMVLGASPSPWVDSSAYALSVGMPVDSTGTLTFMDGVTVLGTGDISVIETCSNTVGCATAGAGLIVELAPGAHSLVATYPGDGNYNSAASTISLMVGTVSPGTGSSATITWAQPAPITHGTVLDSTELNAVLSVPGGCTYSPVTGTVLPAGVQTLFVTCTPTDLTDYSELTDAVFLTVSQALPTITVSSSANPSNVNQSVTLTASLPTDATGTVQFQVDGSNIGDPADLSSGVASFSIATLVAGSHAVSAVYSGDANYLAGNGTLTQTVNASVAPPSSAYDQCIYALSQTASNALSVNGAVIINAPSCGVVVDSSSSTALSFSGSGSFTAKYFDVVGEYSKSGAVTFTPTPSTKSAYQADPLTFLVPPVSTACTYTNFKASTGSTTLNPGTYCNGIAISGATNVTFNPGTYILMGGGLNVSGASILKGSGVTFFLTKGLGYNYGPLSISGAVVATLSAPTSGSYNGILFYQDPQIGTGQAGNTATGSEASSFNGVLYFPTTALTIAGAASENNCLILVAETIALTGAASVGNGCSGGSPLQPPGSPVSISVTPRRSNSPLTW